ncbi:MAG: glycosyltransferase family 2 protein [Pseudomonadota bacterium]
MTPRNTQDSSEGTKTAPRPQPSVSVVIVSYWTGPLLSRCISSVIAQSSVREVILVDNGNWAHEIQRACAVSPDGSVPIKLISGHGNIGFAAGCNLGAKAADGDHLLILNPDAALPGGGIDRMIAESRALARPWLLGPRLLDPDGGEQAGGRRRVLTPWLAVVEMLKLYKWAPRHPYFRRFNFHQDPCPAETTPVPVISGACMFLPKEDYFAIGGMDEGYFLHVEDVDFCLRFAEAGGGVYFAPDVAVIHNKSSSRTSPVRVEYRKAQSLVRYFWTHFRDPYPWAFLVLATMGVWVAFALRAVHSTFSGAVSWLGFAARSGGDGVRRWRRIAARRGGDR